MLKRLKSGLAGLFAQGNLGQATKIVIFVFLALAGTALATGNQGAAIGFLIMMAILAILAELASPGGKATH